MIEVSDSDGRPYEVRMTAGRKARVVLALLSGQSLETVARDARARESEVIRWRDRFIERGTQGLKGSF
jgi:hypothetical protein